MVTRPALIFEIDGLSRHRLRDHKARSHGSSAGECKDQQIASVDDRYGALLHQGGSPQCELCRQRAAFAIVVVVSPKEHITMRHSFNQAKQLGIHGGFAPYGPLGLDIFPKSASGKPLTYRPGNTPG